MKEFEMIFCFQEGPPTSAGWYLVKLRKGNVTGSRLFDVDRFYLLSSGDLVGKKWYLHNIEAHASFEGVKND